MVSLSLVACDAATQPGSFGTVALTLPGDAGQCLGTIESRSRLGENGSGLVKKGDFSTMKLISVAADPKRFKINWEPSTFVGQNDPDLCWAATLSMALKHGGYNYDQTRFLTALNEKCPNFGRNSATLNQIMYALTAVHTDRGRWISDSDQTPAHGVQMVGMPRPFEWTRKNADGSTFNGGAYPINDTTSFVQYIEQGAPVVVGFDLNGGTHVVLVVGMTARLGGLQLTNAVQPTFGETKIDTVSFIDPLGDGKPTSISYDTLMRGSRFAFAVKA